MGSFGPVAESEFDGRHARTVGCLAALPPRPSPAIVGRIVDAREHIFRPGIQTACVDIGSAELHRFISIAMPCFSVGDLVAVQCVGAADRLRSDEWVNREGATRVLCDAQRLGLMGVSTDGVVILAAEARPGHSVFIPDVLAGIVDNAMCDSQTVCRPMLVVSSLPN